MADLTSTIEIVIGALDATGAGFKSAIDNVGNLAGSVQTATEPLKDLALGVLAVDAALVTMAAAMLKWSIDEASKFDTATREINTLIGLSPGLMKDFSDAIIIYGTTSTQTFGDINGAVYDAISAGVDYKDALDIVRVAENLAVAGKADLRDALNLLVPTLNAYGEDMDSAGQYSDYFFTTVRLGKTTIPELASALGGLAPTAASVGVPLNDIGGALATLTSNGISTGEAATGLKAALSNIIKPSVDAKNAAHELGVEFGVSAIETRGLEGLLQDLYRATGGNADEMARFFGSTEALNTALSLTNDGGIKFKDNLDAMKISSGATKDAFDLMIGSLENVNKNMKTVIDAILIKVGVELLPAMTDISGGLRDIFKGVFDGIDKGEFDVPLGIVNDFLDDIADLLRAAAANLPAALALIDWSDFEDSFDGLRDAIGGIFDDIDITTPEGLADAIQLVVDAFTGIVNVSGGVITGLNPLMDLIGGMVQGFVDAGPKIQTAAGVIAGLGTTVNIAAGAIVGITGAIGTVAGGVGLLRALGLLVSSATTASTGAGVLAAALGRAGLVGAAGAAGYAVGTVLGAGIDLAVQKISGDDNQSLGGAIYDGVQAFKAFVTGVDPVKDALSATVIPMDSVARAARGLADDIPKTTSGFRDLKPLLEQITDPAGKLKTEFDGLGTESADLLTDMMDFNAETTRFVRSQILPELGLGVKGVKEEAESAATPIWELDEATGVYSLTAFGMSSVMGGAKDKISDVSDAMKDAAAETEIMNRASTAFIIEWEKIQSAERVAIFEARADIAVAQIEADAVRTVAAFDSMATSFQNTGDVLTALFGIWAGLDSGFDKNKIAEWIEREYKIREDLAKSQIALVEAEIKRMEAQTALLEKGGVEIKISSDGLEPALEAFMFSVVDKVRVQIAGSYEDFLLGCGS